MIDIDKDNRTKHDIYFLFRRKEDVNAYLAHQKIADGKFRAEDYIDYETGFVEHNNVSHLDTHKLTIQTSSKLDFKHNDYVYDVKYDLTWRIESIKVADDGQMKEYSLRPRKDTFLTLIR